MNTEKVINPFGAPADFRAFAYENVILGWETKRGEIVSSIYKKQTLEIECGLHVLNQRSLHELRDR